jgi:UDP-N-acetylglucosamine 2-epimerase (non-hydrolysing)
VLPTPNSERPQLLSDTENITLLSPLGLCDMHNLLYKSSLVVTDSAGLQEEAFLLEKPTLVLRSQTERIGFLDTAKSMVVSPSDCSLEAKIQEALKDASSRANFGIKKELYRKTGSSKQTVKIIQKLCQC